MNGSTRGTTVYKRSRLFGMSGKVPLSISSVENAGPIAVDRLFLLGWINDRPSRFETVVFNLLARLPYSNVQYYPPDFI